MKFGQILLCCMTKISNMFLTQCWRLETISRLFFDFIIKFQKSLFLLCVAKYCKNQLHNRPFENHFFQKSIPYINQLTDQHCRSTGWSQYDINPFKKTFSPDYIHWLYVIMYSLPECQGTPCLKQVPHLKVKWQQRNSNLQPLSL